MGRIGTVLPSLYLHSSASLHERNEEREQGNASQDADRLLAPRLRTTGEDGQQFLQPGLLQADVAAEMKLKRVAVGGVFTRFIGEISGATSLGCASCAQPFYSRDTNPTYIRLKKRVANAVFPTAQLLSMPAGGCRE